MGLLRDVCLLSIINIEIDWTHTIIIFHGDIIIDFLPIRGIPIEVLVMLELILVLTL